jgi:lipid-binding SYLF domain-containing protein
MVSVSRLAAISFLCLTVAGCATIPGKSSSEQVITGDELVKRTLADLTVQYPQTKDEIAQCVGYVVMNNKLTKIPVVGVGSGYGVAVDNKSGQKTYLRMSRFDLGAGWGARSVRPVLIFQDEEKFRQFIDGEFGVHSGAEASAKVGETGAAGGSGSKTNTKGYSSYLITDAGVSATASVGIIRVKPVKLKK